MEITSEASSEFFGQVLPHLGERQRRVVAGAAAQMLGRSGKTRVAEASGMSRNTLIRRGAGTGNAFVFEPSRACPIRRPTATVGRKRGSPARLKPVMSSVHQERLSAPRRRPGGQAADA